MHRGHNMKTILSKYLILRKKYKKAETIPTTSVVPDFLETINRDEIIFSIETNNVATIEMYDVSTDTKVATIDVSDKNTYFGRMKTLLTAHPTVRQVYFKFIAKTTGTAAADTELIAILELLIDNICDK